MKFSRFVLIALFAALLCAPGYAQTTARLDGIVQDQTRAVVPNAKVVAVNTKTQATADVVTDGSDNFVFPQLQPGIYNVTVESAGFRRSVLSNVELTVGGTVSHNVKLEVGKTSESVG